MVNNKLYYTACLLLCFSFLTAQLSPKEIDKLVKETAESFDVPGISVGVVQDGKTIYSGAYGTRSMYNNKAMQPETLVGIASNSKGFTCFALAMLVDEGKMSWDDPVTKYIPEFRLKDAWVTKHFTVQDLVTHRSGLGLGAGDLMFFPEGGAFTTADIIHSLQFVEPSTSFRSEFEYNNNMFIVAGEVLKRISGLSWEDFIEERIMKPVGMNSSYASFNRVPKNANRIDAHAPVDGTVKAIPHDWNPIANPAGGIMSNIPDMLTWANFLMNDAVTKSGDRLLSEKQLHHLWTLHSPIKVSKNHPYDSHFYGYGLGWFLSDVKGGFLQVTHTGGLIGTVTQFTLLPEKDLGIVVLTNQQSGAAFSSITNTIKDSYLGYGDRNWIAKKKKRSDEWMKYNDSIKLSIEKKIIEFKDNPCYTSNDKEVVGTYKSDWMGNFEVYKDDQVIRIKSEKSKNLVGSLYPFSTSAYVVRWDNRSYDADVYLLLNKNAKGKIQNASMTPVAPITDFSFDFDDLKLKKIK